MVTPNPVVAKSISPCCASGQTESPRYRPQVLRSVARDIGLLAASQITSVVFAKRARAVPAHPPRPQRS